MFRAAAAPTMRAICASYRNCRRKEPGPDVRSLSLSLACVAGGSRGRERKRKKRGEREERERGKRSAQSIEEFRGRARAVKRFRGPRVLFLFAAARE